MRIFRQRLRRGNPTWVDQLVFRLPGLALLAGCWRLMVVLIARGPIGVATFHAARVLTLPVLVVVSLESGLLLFFLGPGLLQEYPWPITGRYRPPGSFERNRREQGDSAG